MPRFSQGLLDSVIYLYPSEEAAKEGVAAGGTGFLLGMGSETHPTDGDIFFHLYAVTNLHVVNDYGKSPVIRFNTTQGGAEIIGLASADWISHPDGDDIAITYLGFCNARKPARSILLSLCITPEVAEQHDIGPGDEVYTLGRFIGHSGRARNEPSARSGIISMMPSEPIEHEGRLQECILVEIRALRGSSGSPVFVSPDPFGRRSRHMESEPEIDKKMQITFSAAGTWLLGIACADLPYEEPVVNRVTGEETDFVAYSNSGQTAVIPAWKIRDFILTGERFVITRKADDEKVAELKKRSALRPTSEKSAEPDPLTKESFVDTIRRVSRNFFQSESEKKRSA